MACKGCHFDHPPMQLCSVAKRLRMANDVANASNTMANTESSVANKIPKADAGVGSKGRAQPDVASRTYLYRDAEARKAYQRDLMRRRRAEGRA
jgi:hypothetical protein